MRVLISVFLLHLHLFGYIGAALGTDQMCAIPTSDDTEFETVELIFKHEGELKGQLSDPKMQEYLRKHFTDNGGSCEEQETTTTITTTVTTGSAQPPTITTDNDGEDTTATNTKPTEPIATFAQTTQAKDTTATTEPAVPSATTTQAKDTTATNVKTNAPAVISSQTTQAKDTTSTNMKTTEPAVTSAKTTQAKATNMKTTEPAVTSGKTTQAKVSSAKVSVETSKKTTTEEATTVIPTCGPLIKTDNCDIVYNEKCYFFHEGPGDNSVSLQDAKQHCETHASRLGNIYDDCHYQYIMTTIGNIKHNHWTGMKVSFSPSVDVILRSGEVAIFWNDKWWLGEEYPQPTDAHNLMITVSRPFPPPQRKGITNADGNDNENKMRGAFCEKNLPG